MGIWQRDLDVFRQRICCCILLVVSEFDLAIAMDQAASARTTSEVKTWLTPPKLPKTVAKAKNKLNGLGFMNHIWQFPTSVDPNHPRLFIFNCGEGEMVFLLEEPSICVFVRLGKQISTLCRVSFEQSQPRQKNVKCPEKKGHIGRKSLIWWWQTRVLNPMIFPTDFRILNGVESPTV